METLLDFCVPGQWENLLSSLNYMAKVVSLACLLHCCLAWAGNLIFPISHRDIPVRMPVYIRCLVAWQNKPRLLQKMNPPTSLCHHGYCRHGLGLPTVERMSGKVSGQLPIDGGTSLLRNLQFHGCCCATNYPYRTFHYVSKWIARWWSTVSTGRDPSGRSPFCNCSNICFTRQNYVGSS